MSEFPQRLAYWTAVSGGAGLAPGWPGTVGAGVGVLFAGVLAMLPLWCTPPALVLLFVVGVWASGAVGRSTGLDDPQIVVIDETFGCAATLCVLPLDPLWWAAGFVAFRFFDIVKPGPIRAIDRKVKGGLGVMADDAAAAVAAGGMLLLIGEAARRLL